MVKRKKSKKKSKKKAKKKTAMSSCVQAKVTMLKKLGFKKVNFNPLTGEKESGLYQTPKGEFQEQVIKVIV